MDKLPTDLLIDITSFLSYDDMCNFFIISKDLIELLNRNKNHIVNNTLKKYNLWIIDNNNSYTIRNKTSDSPKMYLNKEAYSKKTTNFIIRTRS